MPYSAQIDSGFAGYWDAAREANTFFGALPNDSGINVPDAAVKSAADGFNGSVPDDTVTYQSFDDSAWPNNSLFMANTSYATGGPGYTNPPNTGYFIPDGNGAQRWAFRRTLTFPTSATTVTLPAPDGSTYTADPGECLYAMFFWADNVGQFYIDRTDAFNYLLDVGSRQVGGDYTGFYLLSLPPGSHFISAFKFGDTTFDGLTVKLATYPFIAHTDNMRITDSISKTVVTITGSLKNTRKRFSPGTVS